MTARARVVFWAAVAAATILTGGVYEILFRGHPLATAGSVVALVVSVIGLAAALFVAGRILLLDSRRPRS